MSQIQIEDVIEVLEDVREDVDYEHETALVTGKVLDSFDILSIISALNDEFDISIPAKDIVEANFDSAEGLRAMVQRLVDDE